MDGIAVAPSYCVIHSPFAVPGWATGLVVLIIVVGVWQIISKLRP